MLGYLVVLPPIIVLMRLIYRWLGKSSVGPRMRFVLAVMIGGNLGLILVALVGNVLLAIIK